MRRTEKGFSLLELLAVVAIVAIIAAIAIEPLLSSKRAANEGSAQSSLRVINEAQFSWQGTGGNGAFAGTLSTLQTNNLLDTTLGSGTKSGYTFIVTAAGTGNTATYYATAVPTSGSGVAQTGTRRFCVSEDGVIRGDTNATTAFANEAACTALAATGN